MVRDGDNDERQVALDVLKLVPHDPEWAARYSTEARLLTKVEGISDTMHIGSTALPGIDSKPVVDIAVRVDRNPADPFLVRALERLGYACHGEYGLPGRQFFTKGRPATVHLHVVDEHAEHWQAWARFRDYLLAHPEWIHRYQEEKYRIAEKVHWNRAEYTKGKTAFILRVLQLEEEESARG